MNKNGGGEKNIYVSKSSGNKENKKKKSKAPKVILLVLLLVVLCGGAFFGLKYWKDNYGENEPGTHSSSRQDGSSESSPEGSQEQAGSESGESVENSGGDSESGDGGEAPALGTNDYNAIALPEEMRAMWISFLELRSMDASSEESYRAAVAQMFDGCQDLNLNTVIFAIRPFADAMYPSEIFPWSHIISGTQGQDPGYDPLQIAIDEAHARNLRFEAWINPYRVQHPTNGPEVLSEDNPAIVNPDWVKSEGGLWYDPGLPEVREMVALGVVEIVENYQVDGIHFDDYFYPDATADFDAASYEKYGEGTALAVWRRENVNLLIRDVYEKIKAVNPAVSFGISPQGNNENNYDKQYSDVKLWMEESAYVDYVMPQIYWGFNYLKNDKDDAAFNNKLNEWASYAVNPSVHLYCGLGAYRIGIGDGGDGDMQEWYSGHNLADMVNAIRENDKFEGFSIFRYGYLLAPYDGEANSELSGKEAEALKTLLAP